MRPVGGAFERQTQCISFSVTLFVSVPSISLCCGVTCPLLRGMSFHFCIHLICFSMKLESLCDSCCYVRYASFAQSS